MHRTARAGTSTPHGPPSPLPRGKDCGDGLIDITRESDHYTVSWVRFSKHHKTMLLNGGFTHFEDRGKLNGTVHHNRPAALAAAGGYRCSRH
ncbi:MAG: hypothetical protein PVI30_05695 [Myxococcales bacterium]|jgi:pectate lyase